MSRSKRLKKQDFEPLPDGVHAERVDPIPLPANIEAAQRLLENILSQCRQLLAAPDDNPACRLQLQILAAARALMDWLNGQKLDQRISVLGSALLNSTTKILENGPESGLCRAVPRILYQVYSAQSNLRKMVPSIF